MTPRSVVLILTATAIGISGCGGSGRSTTSAASVSSTATQVGLTTSTTSTTTPPPTRTTLRHKNPPKPSVHPVKQPATHPGPTPAQQAAAAAAPNAGLPGAAHVSGPTPNICLRASGLLNAHAMQTETWEALDPTNKRPVFVQGPYKNADQAKASARSLAEVEQVTAAGLYDVSATFPSKLGSKVQAVAQCLGSVRGKGALAY